MLSSLPKLADKAFIIGVLLPTILFFVIFVSLFPDLPLLASLSTAPAEKESFEKLVYVALGAWFGAIVLMMINDVLYRLLEGYFWPVSRISFLLKRKKAEFRDKSTRFEFLRDCWFREKEKFPLVSRTEFDVLRRELVTRFPSKADLILPTRFGNAIRAFEDYPDKYTVQTVSRFGSISASAACAHAVMSSAPSRCAGSVPRLPFERLTMSTLPLFITSGILSVEEF